MTPRWWLFVIMPALVFGSLILVAYAHADAHPLPWNGYGHTALHVDSSLTIPALSRVTVRILGDEPISAKSFVWTQLYVLTRGTDGNPLAANFQFSYNGVTSEIFTGWGMGREFETTVETRGDANPWYLAENIQPVDIVVHQVGWVTVPPSTWEHFGILIPWVVLGGVLVSVGLDTVLALALRPARHTPA